MSSFYEKGLKPRKTLNSSSLSRAQLSESAELRRMVQHFRVSELQEFLQAFGHTRTGKKQVLQNKAYSLIGKNITLVKTKINEINTRSHTPSFSSAAFTVQLKHSHTDSTTMSTSASQYLHSNPLSQQDTPPQQQFQSPTITLPSHTQPAVLHPDVRFVKPTFFEELHVLLRPTSLAAISKKNYPGNQGIHHESTLKFALSPQQLNHIKANTIGLDDNMGDVKQVRTRYDVQIQLRFCLQETSCEQLDNFPINMHIKVNHKYIQVNGYHPGLSNRPEYKRTGRPVDITALCRNIPPSEVNLVQIYWTPDLYNIPTGHVIMCSLVKTINSKQLLNQLKSKAVRSAEHSRALIKEKFRMSDCEVSATSYRVSLLCPLGKVKMNYPCRARSCSHLQCFDAELYLQMNEKKSTWICPICDKSSQFADLILDDLFTEILQQSKGFEEIEFDQDGSWYSISEKGEKGKKMQTLFPTTPLLSHKLPIVLDVSPSSEGKSCPDNTTSESESVSPQPPPIREKTVNFIDLTLDSDSDSEVEIPTSTTRNPIPPTVYHQATQHQRLPFESTTMLDLQASVSTDNSLNNAVQYLTQQQIVPSLTIPNTHILTHAATKSSGSHTRMHPTSPGQSAKRHKQYHSPTALFSSLMNTNIHAHKTTGSPQVHTPQRSPDSTTDTNIAYVTYPTTYLQVPIPLEQTTDSISSSHSSQQSNSSPHTLAYALPAQFQNTFAGYHSTILPVTSLEGQDGLDFVEIIQGDYLNSVSQNLAESLSPSILQQENIIFNDPQLTTNSGHIYHIPSTAHFSHQGVLDENNEHTPIVRLQISPEAFDDSNSGTSIIAIDCPSN